MFIGDLKRAILETLAYSDIFEFPLRLDEIHRYLSTPADLQQIADTLPSLQKQVETKDGYYFLPGRAEIVEIRIQRERHSRSLLPFALRYGRILGSLPFVRMVALTGSLAVLNVSKNIDFDYMLVTVPGHLWTARAFALAFNRITRLFGHTLCPNLIVTETALEWPLHDLYSARELCQMIPITGMDVYQKVIQANAWARMCVPNAFPKSEITTSKPASFFQKLFELPLQGNIGKRLEQWEMNRKIKRFSKQEGFGEETIFNAEVCQGNFHHHRKWTQDIFEKKLLNIDSALESPQVQI